MSRTRHKGKPSLSLSLSLSSRCEVTKCAWTLYTRRIFPRGKFSIRFRKLAWWREEKFSRYEIREIEGNRYMRTISWDEIVLNYFRWRVLQFFFFFFFSSPIRIWYRIIRHCGNRQDRTFLTIRNGRSRYSGQTFQLAGPAATEPQKRIEFLMRWIHELGAQVKSWHDKTRDIYIVNRYYLMNSSRRTEERKTARPRSGHSRIVRGISRDDNKKKKEKSKKRNLSTDQRANLIRFKLKLDNSRNEGKSFLQRVGNKKRL